MAKKTTNRSAQGAGTIRQRPDGRWEARYTAGKDPGTGKQIQRSLYAATQKEVRQKLTAALAELDKGVYFEPNKITVKDWLHVWLNTYVKGTVKPYTFRSYETQINQHLCPALGAVPLPRLSSPAIQLFYTALHSGESPHKGATIKPLSPKTIKNIHGVFHKALQKTVDLHYIPFNPADACTLPRVEKPDIKPLDEEQTAHFLEAVEKDPLRNVFLTAIFTGMRKGELLGLSWNNVNFDTGTVTIKQQLQRDKRAGGGYYLETPKNGKTRTISPAPFVLDVLREEKRAQNAAKLRAGRAWGNPWNLVFTDALGRHLAIDTVYNHFKKLAASIGLPDVRFHDLRHTYAVTALRAGDDIKTVQETLGHATASFTLDVYGHVTEQMKQASAQRMQRYIDQIKKA